MERHEDSLLSVVEDLKLEKAFLDRFTRGVKTGIKCVFHFMGPLSLRLCRSAYSGCGVVVVYLDTRGGEVGDLKLDTDGGLPFLVLSLNTGQAKVCSHQVLLTALLH